MRPHRADVAQRRGASITIGGQSSLARSASSSGTGTPIVSRKNVKANPSQSCCSANRSSAADASFPNIDGCGGS